MISRRSLWLPLLALGGAVLIGGCGGGLGALVGAALCALALLLHGCGESEHCRDYLVCVDGELSTENLCCPEGMECNYGQAPVRECGDGSCVQFGLCPGETPDSGVEPMCEEDAGSESCGDAG